MKKLLAIIALASFVTTFASEQKTINDQLELKLKDANNTSVEIQKLTKRLQEIHAEAERIYPELWELAAKSESEQIRSLGQQINPIFKKLKALYDSGSPLTAEMDQLQVQYHKIGTELDRLIRDQGNAELKNKIKELDAKEIELKKIIDETNRLSSSVQQNL